MLLNEARPSSLSQRDTQFVQTEGEQSERGAYLKQFFDEQYLMKYCSSAILHNPTTQERERERKKSELMLSSLPLKYLNIQSRNMHHMYGMIVYSAHKATGQL